MSAASFWVFTNLTEGGGSAVILVTSDPGVGVLDSSVLLASVLLQPSSDVSLVHEFSAESLLNVVLDNMNVTAGEASIWQYLVIRV